MATTIPPVVMITGANQGLGFCIAQIFSQSKNPYTIVVGARNPTRGSEAVAKLTATKSNPQSTVASVTLDLTSSKSIGKAIDAVSKDYGRLDVLVNNAGAFYPTGSSETRDDWRAIFELNVFGTMELTQCAFPLLEKSSDPKVVVVTSNMGSISMVRGGNVPMGAVGSPYAASKAAINMMVANWVHTQKNVRFWAVCPGLCATEFGGDFTKQYGKDPKLGAEVVRQCVEGEREEEVGRVVYEEQGKRGVYDW
ncbi:NAD(P)-binding protein [Lentithecium fluviatile CBS 122367]|uniref:NAD(P)-binding protein n=1 Tax=Lentithecium fluviatile CBS 122367 TaxID=1168545 RepID=A0A6G1JHC5_9PLEO|nr:NAD(P)-binding protein [Lentithecium fluviatile CBS 122367]